jgi:cell division protein FtsI (penicillin-binding protein 3)
MGNFSSIRAACVMGSIALLMTGLLGRVAFLETYGRQNTLEIAERQQHTREALLARRGAIFDSTGVLMAGTIQTKTLFIDPKFMQEQFQTDGHSLVEMDAAVNKLAKIIDQDPFKLSQLIGDRAQSRFVKVAEHLDQGTCDAIEKLDLPGVGLLSTNERYYPMGSLAAHVIGDVQSDGVGLEGLELKFDKKLAGKDGFKRTLRDFRGRPIAVAAEDYLPPQHGQHLILTIDGNIQLITEQELGATCEQYRAKRGEAVVMDPYTGNVLAMADWPTFNPQNLEDSKPDIRRNRAITDPYEPGSCIKPFIVGPAMQWNITRAAEVWPIDAITWNPFGRRIVRDVEHYGPLSTWDVLVKSSNIGMSMLGTRMGNQRLHDALSSFHFGQRTGIELPGEDPGLLEPVSKMGMNSTISVSQGYEVMVTPLQLCRAFCAYANGGKLVEPHIVKGFLDDEGNIISRNDPKALKLMPQAVDPVTALAIRRILCDVLVRGTAVSARSRVYNIFGKTGTAHISEGKKGYSQSRMNGSFMGGAPAENPKLVVFVVVHEPDKHLGHYGGTVAAPAARNILERSLAYMEVPSSPDLPPPPPAVANVLVNYNENVYARRSDGPSQREMQTAARD